MNRELNIVNIINDLMNLKIISEGQLNVINSARIKKHNMKVINLDSQEEVEYCDLAPPKRQKVESAPQAEEDDC